MSNVEKKPFRVILWCVPRSATTAISKCFSFIDNTQTWFEPFCGLDTLATSLSPMGIAMPKNESEIDEFLKKIEAGTQGSPMAPFLNTKKLNRTMLVPSSVQECLNSVPADKNVFVKDIASALKGRYDLLPRKEAGYRHTFLIRHPERMFPSFRNLLLKWIQMNGLAGPPDPSGAQPDFSAFDFTRDIPNIKPGFPYDLQYDLWKHVKENYEEEPVVMDIDEMLSNPAEMLPKFFKAVGMPWDEKYLSWDPSPEHALDWRWVFKMEMGEDSFGSIHKQALTSHEFAPSKPVRQRAQMTPDIIKSIEGAMEYYNEMAGTRITV